MNRVLLLALLLFCGGALRAQEPCGFSAHHQAHLAANPAYAAAVAERALAWQAAHAGGAASSFVTTGAGGTVYEIPVVIHVIHPSTSPIGSLYNPSDAQLIGMIDYLNQTYAATWASYPDTASGGTRFPVRFVLAKRDTNCASTTGIVRVSGSGVADYDADGITGATEVDVKNLSRWPNRDYYNIWVVNKIDGFDGTSGGGTLGYAYYPGAGASVDGTVILAQRSIGGESTLPHEMGHAFALAHTFEGGSSSSCPPNTNCLTQGDEICDTEPHQEFYNCPTGTNPCTGVPYAGVQYNIMGYSNCADRFTPGQRDYFIFNLINSRPALMSSTAGLPLPSAAPPPVCIPAINFPSNTFNAGPRDVEFADLNISSSGYNGDGSKVHVDRYCLHGTEVMAGSTYSLSVLTGSTAHKVRVYIDYNNNGSFADAGDLVYTHDGSTGFETHTGTVTIPTTAFTCIPLRMRVVADRSSAPTVPSACGPLDYGQAEDYAVIVKPQPASLINTLTAGSSPSCFGTSLTFTAAPAAGTLVSGYQWMINGAAVAGATGSSFTTSAPGDGDAVSVKMLYTSACGADSVLSNSVVVLRAATVPAAVSAGITTGTNPGCAGQPLTFTATPSNGGATPAYQWFVNGTPVAGATGVSFSSSTLSAGDAVAVAMLSSSSCASPTTAASMPIVISFTSAAVASVSIAQTAGPVPACAGKPIVFTATPVNEGDTPVYIWTVNGTPVVAGADPTLTISTLANGDVVSAALVSNSPCVAVDTVFANAIPVTVQPADPSSLSVALTAGSNPGCLDSLVEYTMTVVNLGAAPVLQWFVNGVPVASGPVFSSTTLANGDVLTAQAYATEIGCRTQDTVSAAAITLVRSATPDTPLISFINGVLVASASPVQWYGPRGAIAGATGASIIPDTPGYYYAVATNNGCASAASNVLQLSALDILRLETSSFRAYPNPTSGAVTIDWGPAGFSGEVVVMNSVGQELRRLTVPAGTPRTAVDLGAVAPGLYYLIVRDPARGTGAIPVTVIK